VTVEGHPLEIYGVKEEGDKTIAYIEAMVGKQFKVCFYDGRHKVEDSHVVRMFLDGVKYAYYLAPLSTVLTPFPAGSMVCWQGQTQQSSLTRRTPQLASGPSPD
jgi:hypothetical protein